MITHLLLTDPSLHDASENYNRAVPADEVALFSKPIRDFVEKITALAHSAADPSAYATQLLARLCPAVLPYELDTPASFSFAGFNGRGLCDDVMDVILTLVTNTALGDGVAPDAGLMRPDFPYFGEPHAYRGEFREAVSAIAYGFSVGDVTATSLPRGPWPTSARHGAAQMHPE